MDLNLFVSRGGLPLSCFTRDNSIRKKWYEDYLEVLLSRDLVMVDESLASVSIRQGLQMLRTLALWQGKEISITDLSDAGSVRPLVAKKYLQALEALCVIESIFPIGRAAASTRRARYEWKDIGLWNHVCLSAFASLDHEPTLRLALTQEFRSQLAFESKMVQWNFYRTHNFSYIPWIFQKGSQIVCMTTVLTESPKPYDYRSIKQFVEKEKHAIGIVLSTANCNLVELSPRVWMLPYTCVF
jgi:predicted AAA+ superfamily ATPase